MGGHSNGWSQDHRGQREATRRAGVPGDLTTCKRLLSRGSLLTAMALDVAVARGGVVLRDAADPGRLVDGGAVHAGDPRRLARAAAASSALTQVSQGGACRRLGHAAPGPGRERSLRFRGECVAYLATMRFSGAARTLIKTTPVHCGRTMSMHPKGV